MALPPYKGPVVAVQHPEPTAENCRCWRCWHCPCRCPEGQGLRGPIPPELRSDPAAPTVAQAAPQSDSETVWPGDYPSRPRDPEAVLPGRFDGKWGAREYLAEAAALEDRAALVATPPPAPPSWPLPERCYGGCDTLTKYCSHGAWCSHHWRLVTEEHRAALAAAQDLQTYRRAVAAARTAVAAEERRRYPRFSRFST